MACVVIYKIIIQQKRQLKLLPVVQLKNLDAI